MIEAMIRDDKRLICVVAIRQGPDKDRLDVDIFIPGKGTTLSGVMPDGGEAPQQVARAIMTVYPVSALTPELDETEKTKPADSEKADWASLDKIDEKMNELDKREAYIRDREKKLEQDIENLRKSHPENDQA